MFLHMAWEYKKPVSQSAFRESCELVSANSIMHMKLESVRCCSSYWKDRFTLLVEIAPFSKLLEKHVSPLSLDSHSPAFAIHLAVNALTDPPKLRLGLLQRSKAASCRITMCAGMPLDQVCGSGWQLPQNGGGAECSL